MAQSKTVMETLVKEYQQALERGDDVALAEIDQLRRTNPAYDRLLKGYDEAHGVVRGQPLDKRDWHGEVRQ